MSPGEADAARWESSVGELAHRVESSEGYLLALVVGAGGALHAALVRDLRARLAPGFEVRPIAVTPEQPNPLPALMEEPGIERQVILLHGLAALSYDERKHVLHMLNWARSQLTRRPMKIVLWVEPGVVAQLYQFAGDFADWWTVLIELPETAPEPIEDPLALRSRWDLAEELEEKWRSLRRLREAGEEPPAELESAVEQLSAAVQVNARPGQVVAGARLTGGISPQLWHAVEVETGADCLVHVVADLDELLGFLWTLDLLRRLEGTPNEGWRGVVRLRRVDERVLAYSTSKPSGLSLPRALTDRSWSLQERVDLVLAVIDTVMALERMGLFLRDLRPSQIWLDQDAQTVFVGLDGFGQAGDPPKEDLGGLVRGYIFPHDKVLSETRDSLILGLLLVYVVSGQRYDEATLQGLERSTDASTWALAKVATKAVQDDPRERYGSPASLRRSIVFARHPAAAVCWRLASTASVAIGTLVGAGILLLVLYGVRWTIWTWWTVEEPAPSYNELQSQLETSQRQLDALKVENAGLKQQVQTLNDYIRLLKAEQAPAPPQSP